MKKAAVVFITLIVAGLTAARTITVDDDGPAEFTTIQTAIDDANEGDTILVSSGTYNENIHLLGKNITLISTDPDNQDIVANTVINGGGIGPVVTFAGTENQDCRLNGFTITAGNSAEPEHGGGIRGNATGAAIENCVVTGNSSYRRGGGLFDFDGPITNCAITENSASWEGGRSEGGGLHSCDGVITDCTISNNTSGSPTENGFGGGLYSCQGPITGCALVGNYAGGSGGGLYRCGGRITNCSISNNRASLERFQSRGGGLYDCDGSISGCTITDNIAWESGGGLYRCNGGISNCLINSNETHDWNGGGLANCNSVRNCTITGNSSARNGGGLSSCLSVSRCVIADNSAVGVGGALYDCSNVINCTVAANNANGRGGAYYLQGSATVSNCILWNNTAANGPEICLEPYIIHGEMGDIEVPSSINVRFSDVRGGLGAVSAVDCTVNWGPGNLDLDPCFADPNNNGYQLKSQAGRYDPNTQNWILDEVTSPCIDGGDPMTPVGHEPFPNGGIVNMGVFGGTGEASKSYFGKPPCEIIVAGDVNGDCIVDFRDAAIAFSHWLEDNSP